MESATYWQQLFTQALRITQRWRAEHTRSEGVLAAAAEFQSRLHLLSRTGPGAGAGTGASAPCVLAQLPDALALLRGKHLRGLENIMAALRESVAAFAALHAELAALHVRLPRARTRRPPTTPSTARARIAAARPSLSTPTSAAGRRAAQARQCASQRAAHACSGWRRSRYAG